MNINTGDLIGMWVAIVGLCTISGAIFYSIGYREGRSDGYVRGRAVSRHISAKAGE